VVYEHCNPGTKEHDAFLGKHKGNGNCAYWPHFSFRPSVIRVSTLKDIGSFYKTGHFEMAYAREYTNRGYLTTFLDTFCCLHIGKKTWEKEGINSYNLNQTGQFNLNLGAEIISINILSNNSDFNLWRDFKENSLNKLDNFNKCNLPNISVLDSYLLKLFKDNEFNYSRQFINEVMFNINLMRTNQNKYMLVLRENIILDNDFKNKLDQIISNIKDTNYDFILLDENINSDKLLNKTDIKLNLETTNGYIISKIGINKIAVYLDNFGVKNSNYLENLDIEVFVPNIKLYEVKNIDKVKNNDFEKLEGYTFYSQMDSFGSDIICCGKDKSLEEYKEICEKEKGVCFNTLGYIKSSICDKDKLIYLPNSKFSDGLYIKN
jgi:hypothetical protein